MSNNMKIIIDFVVLAILYKVVFFNRWRAKGKGLSLYNGVKRKIS
jgi:hypothetical protein